MAEQSGKLLALETALTAQREDRARWRTSRHATAKADAYPDMGPYSSAQRDESADEEAAIHLAQLARVPYVDLSEARIDPELAQHLKRELALRYGCFPLEAQARSLLVAAAHPLDPEARRILEFATGQRVEVLVAPQADVHAAQRRLYDSDRLFWAYTAAIPIPTLAFPDRSATTAGASAALPASITRMLALLAADALEHGASEAVLATENGWTTVVYDSHSASAPAFTLPGWVGTWLHRSCAVASSRGGQRFEFAAGGNHLFLTWTTEEDSLRRSLRLALSTSCSPPPKSIQAPSPVSTFSCPRCGTTALHRATLCPHCKLPLWRLCRECGGRLHASQPACSCCGAAATPAPAAHAAVPLAPTGPLLRTRPVGAPPDQLHILVVDDQADVRHCMASAFRNLPARVSTADSGEQALAILERDPAHLLVLDMIMPGMDGFQVIAQLRASVRTAFIPVLAVTVLDPLDSRLQQALGPDDLSLQKPFSRQDLLTRAARLARLTYGFKLPACPPVVEGVPRDLCP